MDQYKHEYTKIFAAFDKDGSGTISTKELGDVMNTLGALLSAEELDTIVREVDADDSGQIDFDEFCTCMAKAKEKAGGESSGENRWNEAAPLQNSRPPPTASEDAQRSQILVRGHGPRALYYCDHHRERLQLLSDHGPPL